MDTKKTLLICLVILIAGATMTLLIFSTEPTATKGGAVKKAAMLVEVIEAQRGDYTPTIRALGTVRPAQDITLSPRVEGEVVDMSESFAPGGYVEKGEVLLRIDPADYRNILAQRKSELQQAEADLQIEMGRQSVALQDYQLLGDSLTGGNNSLVLREPQLNAAKSRVASARAAVQQAELDLQRTTIRATFNAYIISRNVSIGSQVSRGDDLARLVGLDEYWVETTVPLAKLRWINVPKNGENGAPVTIWNKTAWKPDENRQGSIFRLLGALEADTRLARLLVSVPDPQGYLPVNKDQPRLMIGSFVEADIQAQKLKSVFRLQRDYVRQDASAWIMENDTLRIRSLDIVFQDEIYAYVSGGLKEGDQIVTTNLSIVVDGSPLRREGK